MSSPGCTTSPERGSARRTPGGGSAGGRLGVVDVPLDREHVQHPSRADERARDLVDGFRRGAQRDDEERRVAVEGDQLADLDLPLDGEAGTEPGDGDDEEPGDEHLGGVERRLRQRHAHAGRAHLLRAYPVAVEERLLAADPAQHAQAGGGVGAERGQLADLLALLALARLQRLDHKREQRHQHGNPDQDHEPERHRRGEQDERDDDVGDDRSEQACGDLERSPGAHRVVRDGRDDLSCRELRADRRPGAGDVVRDELRHAEGCLDPVEDGHAVSHHAGCRLCRTESEQDERPDGERVIVLLDDPELDRSTDRERDQRLRDHPEHAEQHPHEEGAALLPADPDEQAGGRARIRVTGVGDRQLNGPKE